MIDIGNNELENLPKLGKNIICPHCGKIHKIEYGKRILDSGEKVEDRTVAFVKCGEDEYLVGIDGFDITSLLKKRRKKYERNNNF